MASSLTKDSVRPGNPGSEKTFFGHPRGLATLFMTEMWERFSYYGMRALLPLYLVAPGGLHLSAAMRPRSTLYVSLVYLLALPGGWFADRLLGPRKTVALAGFIIMLGHLTLALPSAGTFYAGLGLVAIGSGLLKANISTMVGHLYNGPDDARRDVASRSSTSASTWAPSPHRWSSAPSARMSTGTWASRSPRSAWRSASASSCSAAAT